MIKKALDNKLAMPKEERLDFKLMSSLFMIVTIDTIVMGIVLPLLPFYAKTFGASSFQIGILFMTFSLCQVVAGPILGQLSDRFQRKPILIISQLGTFFSLILLGSAESLKILFLSRILSGITAGNLSVALSYAVDASVASNRKQATAFVGSGIGLGFFIGPALSSFFAHFSHTAPIWIAAGLSAISLIANIILLPQNGFNKKHTLSKTASGSILKSKKWLKKSNILSILFVLGFFYFALGMLMSGLALFLSEKFMYKGVPFGAIQLGWVFSLTGLLSIAVQVFLLRWIAKFISDEHLIVISLIIMGMGYFSIEFVKSTPMLALSLLLGALGSSLFRPTIIALLSLSMPLNRQGMTMGLNQSVMAIGNVIGPLLTGIFMQNKTYFVWTTTITFLLLNAVLLSLICIKKGIWSENKLTH